MLDEDAFAVLLNRPRTEQVLSDMASDSKGLEGDHERRIVRSRAARQLAMWSPRRRRVQRMEVVGLDCEVVRGSAAVARELAPHWWPVFSASVGVSEAARDRFLSYTCDLGIQMRRLMQAEFVEVLRHARDSAPGPDGLAHRAWPLGGPLVERLLHAAYLDISAGRAPPSSFNSALLTFIPKAAPLNATAYLAEPAKYRTTRTPFTSFLLKP